jgi:hypothetical protein
VSKNSHVFKTVFFCTEFELKVRFLKKQTTPKYIAEDFVFNHATSRPYQDFIFGYFLTISIRNHDCQLTKNKLQVNFPFQPDQYGLKYNYHYHRSWKESSSIFHVQKNDKKCENCRQSPSYHAVECKGFPPILTKSVDRQRG